MEGKTVVITGSTGGIGFYSAQEIARLGAYVIIIGRDEAHVDAVVETLKQETGNAMIERIVGDVFTLQGVQDLATTHPSAVTCTRFKDRLSRPVE